MLLARYWTYRNERANKQTIKQTKIYSIINIQLYLGPHLKVHWKSFNAPTNLEYSMVNAMVCASRMNYMIRNENCTYPSVYPHDPSREDRLCYSTLNCVYGLIFNKCLFFSIMQAQTHIIVQYYGHKWFSIKFTILHLHAAAAVNGKNLHQLCGFFSHIKSVEHKFFRKFNL